MLLYVLAFIALTVPLTWLWEVWAREAYGVLFRTVAAPIYELLGARAVPAPARERYINYIPFLALMLLTPGFGAKRRLAWTAVGAVVLFASHIVLNLIAASSRYRGMLPPPLALFSDAMPFLLWAVIARDFVLGFARAEAGEDGDAPEPRTHLRSPDRVRGSNSARDQGAKSQP